MTDDRASRDPVERFGNRVDDYVRYRPGYPTAVTDYLRERGWLWPGAVVADVGAGTGISSALFLDAGCVVHAVEPNAPMRAAAESRLGAHRGFQAVDGRAEATTLAADSVDLVAAGTAFHWFDAAETRAEFARVLRGDGHVVLFWNLRRQDDFMRAYEAILRTHSRDYAEVESSRRADEIAIRAFFGEGFLQSATFPNAQRLDFDGLLGRARSSSYVPKPGDAAYAPLRDALRELFERSAVDGNVAMHYDTRLYVGRLR
ncbi:class I SAM-dependent methyltransferase [Dokdonella sp.]|uniref:class I SAM-dependent methyltransferase n=1 Tax=Dokdonella sp. TaxID=2291710 RepID=UPI001B22F9D3|nr:class I SAM-dependent methyltransferase [Dokdonella sp.]MBO9662837.1 class I SAM-dependent methyltransferase [Dokdonella sp.]